MTGLIITHVLNVDITDGSAGTVFASLRVILLFPSQRLSQDQATLSQLEALGCTNEHVVSSSLNIKKVITENSYQSSWGLSTILICFQALAKINR